MFAELSDFLRLLPAHLHKLWGPHIGTQLLWDDSIPEDKRKMRIPHDGDGKKGEPDFSDTSYFPSLDKLIAVGVNGWDWPDRQSRFVTFDLDSLLNHVEGLTPERIAEIIVKLKAVPWVQIVRSKSGHGFHIRVFFHPFPIAHTHTEHARNAERALAYLSQITGIDLKAAIDACGAIAWIYHVDTAENGFELIKDVTECLDLYSTPELTTAEPSKELLESGEVPPPQPARKIKPGPKHKELIAYAIAKGGRFDEEANRLHTHTNILAQAVEDLELHPGFQTNSEGNHLDHENCFAYPGAKGSWRVVRHTKGVKEHESWETTSDGWTATWLNKAEKKEGAADWPDAIVADALQHDKFFFYRGVGYAQVMRRGHLETLAVEEEVYKRLLRVRFRAKHHRVAKAEWLHNAIAELAAFAVEECEECPVYIRVAYHGGKVYIDLCDRGRTVIEIDGDGWRKAEDVPVRFYRNDKMLPLPYPQRGGTLDALKQFVNIHGNDWPLFIGALLGCFLPEGTFPILSLIGGDGRCKTCLLIVILSLIDPNEVQGNGPPESYEDLILAARQHYLVVFDNLTTIPGWLSDGLCRLCSGAASERRKKYTDSDTSAFIAKRPIVLTSIKDVIDAPDLDSRALKFELPEVETRKREARLWHDFGDAKPLILGALYDAVSCGLRNLPNAKESNLPRLADFGAWCEACEPATGLVKTDADKGIILRTYRAAREAALSETLSSGFAERAIALAKQGFSGTGKQFATKMEALEQYGRPVADDEKLFVRTIPDVEIRKMVDELRKLQTALESVGISVDFRPKSNGKRLIEIKMKQAAARNPAA